MQVWQLPVVFSLIHRVFPQVNREFDLWQARAERILDPFIREQALRSLQRKKFHCQGGSVFAIYPQVGFVSTIKLIVAFQIISDFLDNLCDCSGIYDETAFRHLHLALIDAANPENTVRNYYQYYPFKNDSGYLNRLVQECQVQVAGYPYYQMVRSAVQQNIEWYNELQTLKHLDPTVRDDRLWQWTAKHTPNYQLSPWEFAAATGSTLGIFCLFAMAQQPGLDEQEVNNLQKVYFPAICGLHILLDYLIDLEEDRETNDLNFVSYYPDLQTCQTQLIQLFRTTLILTKKTRYPEFHRTLVRGLLALYLSDPKTNHPELKPLIPTIIASAGTRTWLMYQLSLLLRRFKQL